MQGPPSLTQSFTKALMRDMPISGVCSEQGSTLLRTHPKATSMFTALVVALAAPHTRTAPATSATGTVPQNTDLQLYSDWQLIQMTRWWCCNSHYVLAAAVVQADAVLSSDPGQVLSTVQCHENGPCSSRAPLGHWPSQRQWAGICRIRHLQRGTGEKAAIYSASYIQSQSFRRREKKVLYFLSWQKRVWLNICNSNIWLLTPLNIQGRIFSY